jgi:hypothetical protein
MDLKYGLSMEIKLKPQIEKITGPLTQTRQYDVMDYYNDTCYVELKCRKCLKNTYTTTMVGMNKIEFALKDPTKDYYFFFNFIDGLYYWKSDFEKITTFEQSLGGRSDRGKPEIRNYLYIPITELIEASDCHCSSPSCCSRKTPDETCVKCC